MRRKIPLQNHWIRAEAINVLVAVPQRVIHRHDLGAHFKRTVFVLCGKYSANAATSAKHVDVSPVVQTVASSDEHTSIPTSEWTRLICARLSGRLAHQSTAQQKQCS